MVPGLLLLLAAAVLLPAGAALAYREVRRDAADGGVVFPPEAGMTALGCAGVLLRLFALVILATATPSAGNRWLIVVVVPMFVAGLRMQFASRRRRPAVQGRRRSAAPRRTPRAPIHLPGLDRAIAWFRAGARYEG